MSTNRLLLIDGHSVAFRAFYALPAENFQTSTGAYTNAIYGFMSMFARMIEEAQPSRIAVAFDVSRRSFRTEEYPEYKATRDETPAEFKGQVDQIKALLQGLGITCLELENYEADDILATLATRGETEGMEVVIASGDRDTFQLITEKVSVLYPGSSMSDLRKMTPAAVRERYGVEPHQYPEIAALVGETSDNLPGVPGVGPKTAAQWINKFGGLEKILVNHTQIGGKRGAALADHLEDVKRNRRLNALVTNLPLQVSIDSLGGIKPNRAVLEELFDSLEINRLRERLYALGEDSHPNPVEPVKSERKHLRLENISDLDQWLADQGTQCGLYVKCLGSGANQVATTITISGSEEIAHLPLSDLTPEQETCLTQWLRADNGKILVDAKAAHHGLRNAGYELGPVVRDLALEAYVMRPEMRAYTIEELSSRYLHRDLSEGQTDLLSQLDPTADWQRAEAVADLSEILAQEISEEGAQDLIQKIELPVQEVLTSMEQLGIAMDADVLQDLRNEFSNQAEQAAAEAYAANDGQQVNLSSPKQLQEVLFERLNMPKTRRTKRGYTTNAAALAELFAKTQHPFLQALLTHRDRIKLLQTVDGLIKATGEDGRIHTTFQQTVAATGRLSSSDPNLQNIPARTPDGLQIRAAFVAGPDYECLMTADYSQIEMRIMAHMSADAELIAAFNLGEDLHRTMAAMVFGKSADEVTPADRSHIKATSYGLAYGLSAFGLSKQLGIDVAEAKSLMKGYFERFGGVQKYLQSVVEQARRDGYTQTKFGRRRYLPELNSDNRQAREMAERAALNAPIQGTAADIIKIAMIDLQQRLQGYRSRLLLQVHDELVLEIAPGEREEIEQLVREAMSGADQLSVPLDVSVGVGHSWKSAAH